MAILNETTPLVNRNHADDVPAYWAPVGPGNAREWGGGDPPDFDPGPDDADRDWWAEESGRLADQQHQRDYYAAIADRGDPRDH